MIVIVSLFQISHDHAVLVGQTSLRLGLSPGDGWMASFSPIKLCDDDGGGGGVAAMLVYTEIQNGRGRAREGTLPLLINESAASEARRPHSISPKCN